MSQKKSEIICLCNSITRDKIEEAIIQGASTTDSIYDKTGAGVGPCGGSCRPKIKKHIHYFLKHGKFSKKFAGS